LAEATDVRRAWIVGGWIGALVASALPVVWVMADYVERNHLGKFVDPETGGWTSEVYSQFFNWWWPIAVPVTVLALVCMILNRPERRG
jgi:hypothetical protein